MSEFRKQKKQAKKILNKTGTVIITVPFGLSFYSYVCNTPQELRTALRNAKKHTIGDRKAICGFSVLSIENRVW